MLEYIQNALPAVRWSFTAIKDGVFPIITPKGNKTTVPQVGKRTTLMQHFLLRSFSFQYVNMQLARYINV